MPTAARGPKSANSNLQFLIELGENAHDVTDTVEGWAERSNSAVKFLSGTQAFRKYSWLKNAPVVNKVGNFRGMVVSKDAKAFFDITVKNAEVLEMAGRVILISALALEIAKSTNRISSIVDSNEDDLTKAQKLSVATSMIITRTLTAPVVPATHLVATALRKLCNLTHAPASWDSRIGAGDALVKSTYESVTDDDNVLHYINTHLVIDL